MRVVAGRPDPIAQTPMMNAFIRYVALNPYWNSPPDITARKLAPNVLKEGRAYFNEAGLRPRRSVRRRMRTSSIRCRSTGRPSLRAECRSNLRQRPGPANSMGKMKFMFPNQQGIWLHDTPEKEKIEDAAPAAEQRLRPARGCAALRALAVQRPPAADAGRKAGAEGRSAAARAALHHLSDGGAERDVDRLFRRFLRQGSRGGAPARLRQAC